MTKSQQVLVNKLFEEVWNQGKLDVLSNILTPDFTVHFPTTDMQGAHELEKVIADWRNAFPDIHHEIDETIEAGDKIIVRWQGTGTHKGIFMSLLPTGRKMSYSGITIFKTHENKLTDAWVSADVASIFQQLEVYSTKSYTDNDFDVDFNGPAGRIYRWVMNARPVPACKQKMANALRAIYSTVAYQPDLIIPNELFSEVNIEEIYIPRKGGKVRALVYHPKNKSEELLPVLIYIHGGGWSIGTPEGTDLVTRKIALTSNIIIVSLDYRLAPEEPYPAGLEDCQAAYEWVRVHAKQKLKANPDQVAVGGDSCGGNLAPALTLKLRDEGKKMPDAILAICPLTDFIFEKYPSALKFGPNALLYDFAFLSFVRSVYSAYPKWQHPYISPMYGDLKNFPPTFVLAAGQDLLIDENKVFAEKLKAAGNDVELLIHEEMPHAYYYFLGLCKEEDLAYQAFSKFFARVFKHNTH